MHVLQRKKHKKRDFFLDTVFRGFYTFRNCNVSVAVKGE